VRGKLLLLLLLLLQNSCSCCSAAAAASIYAGYSWDKYQGQDKVVSPSAGEALYRLGTAFRKVSSPLHLKLGILLVLWCCATSLQTYVGSHYLLSAFIFMCVTLLACTHMSIAALLLPSKHCLTLINLHASLKLHSSPATERNKQPILEELRKHLPNSGLVLEVASGTGQHITHFAAALNSSSSNSSELHWQPSDVTSELFGSISAYVADAQLNNVRPPVLLDSSLPVEQWPVQEQCAAVMAANLTHISPW
jgi:hypothetical protein